MIFMYRPGGTYHLDGGLQHFLHICLVPYLDNARGHQLVLEHKPRIFLYLLRLGQQGRPDLFWHMQFPQPPEHLRSLFVQIACVRSVCRLLATPLVLKCVILKPFVAMMSSPANSSITRRYHLPAAPIGFIWYYQYYSGVLPLSTQIASYAIRKFKYYEAISSPCCTHRRFIWYYQYYSVVMPHYATGISFPAAMNLYDYQIITVAMMILRKFKYYGAISPPCTCRKSINILN